MLEEKIEVTRETDMWLYGKLFSRTDQSKPFVFMSDFMKQKSPLWFAQEPKQILSIVGADVDKQRAVEIENLFDGWLGGFYYLEAVISHSGDPSESIKWLMGGVAAHLNETGKKISDIASILPADYLGAFVKYLSTNRFPRSFAKDVFATLLATGKQFIETEDQSKLVSGFEVMDKIIAMPQFKAADDSAIDGFIEQAIAANPEQAAKVAEQPKLVQWFVGQTLKLAKGKAPASDVLAKLKIRFGVD